MAWVQIAAATLSGNSLRQTVHTHCASVHQAAKLVAALLRVARVTAGLAESNGSLPPADAPVANTERNCRPTENYNKFNTINLFLKLQSAFCQFQTVTVSECCLTKLFSYILFEKYICILARVGITKSEVGIRVATTYD